MIHLDAPDVGQLEKEYLNEAIDKNFVSTYAPLVSEFEGKMSDYLGKDTVAMNSGTSALHIALYALGIGKGDEVIVPSMTFVGTVNPILYVGAKPVFVDVDITWNIDPDEIERNITDKTKAIMPVHLYGNPCMIDEIMRIAKEHSLYVIEDAAEALGAKYKGKYVG
ncbi:unnamed protein product, partial [marine sediment metagenome]